MNVTMMTKLCNIVLRRPYLDEYALYLPPDYADGRTKTIDKFSYRVIHPNIEDATRRSFFAKMSDDLFRNVRDLYEQIDAHFAAHGKDRSVGAQIAVRPQHPRPLDTKDHRADELIVVLRVQLRLTVEVSVQV